MYIMAKSYNPRMCWQKKWERKDCKGWDSSETNKSIKKLKTSKGHLACLLFYIEDTNFASVFILIFSDPWSKNWNLKSNTILFIPKNKADYGK